MAKTIDKITPEQEARFPEWVEKWTAIGLSTERADFKTAKKEIQAHSGKQFDPRVVDAFCSLSLDSWEKIRYETTQFLPAFLDMKRLSHKT